MKWYLLCSVLWLLTVLYMWHDAGCSTAHPC